MNIQSVATFQEFKESRFTKKIIYKNRDNTLFILNFIPGQHMPAHYHPGAELFFHILQGTGIFTIDGREIKVGKDDIVHCLGNEKLAFTNTGTENVSIYVSLCSVNPESNTNIEESC